MQTKFQLIHVFFKQTAYLDPGTGSLLIQLLLAGLLGIGVAIRIYWKKIKKLFGGKEKGEEYSDPTEIEDEEDEF